MDVIKDGRVAERILKDDVFRRAVDQVDAKYVRMWRNAEDLIERERAHALQAALDDVITELQTIVDDGEVERFREE